MLRITSESDYALRMVLLLSQIGEKTDAKTLSAKMNVPLRFALKILRNLSACGITTSIKGASGGYMLSRPPSEISFKDIIEAIEGPIALNKCLGRDADCDRVSDKTKCVVHKSFCRVNGILSDELDKITFESII